MDSRIWISLFFLISLGCAPEKEIADTLLFNGSFLSMEDTDDSQIDAIAIKDGLIWKMGSLGELEKYLGESTEKIDLNGAFAMPGLIEGHGHFSSLGFSLIDLNLLSTKSWEEIVHSVSEKIEEMDDGEWLIGRGWHQEKWDSVPDNNVLGYPTHDQLSAISPDNPVLLSHASGHGLFANKKAMDLAGITRETQSPAGGAIIKDPQGNPIGVFEETAMSIIRDAYGDYRSGLDQDQLEDKWFEAIELAQQECIKHGVTSFQDAGTRFVEADRYFDLAENGKLDLRLYLMIRHSSDEMEGKLASIRRINVGNGHATLRAIKSEIDGALGSFGAWLLEPYADKPDFYGQNTTEIKEVEAIAKLAIENDMQLCVHSIGDRANQECLNLFEKYYSKESLEDPRWRIEHSQHLAVQDISRFAELGVIPSMQAVHCISDAPFVEKRLGEQRAREGAYAWRSLIDEGAIIANGTDAPVELIDPFASIYASVTRRRPDNGMVFFPEQSMTRIEALKSYTIWNAYAAFEENEKGSLKEGKYADIIVLDTDLLNCEAEQILDAQVLYTIVSGNIKYKQESK